MANPRYASGKFSMFICDRCGCQGYYRNSVVEPLTGYRVHKQHYFTTPVPKQIYPDAIALRGPRPDSVFEAPDPPVDLAQYVPD